MQKTSNKHIIFCLQRSAHSQFIPSSRGEQQCFEERNKLQNRCEKQTMIKPKIPPRNFTEKSNPATPNTKTFTSRTYTSIYRGFEQNFK